VIPEGARLIPAIEGGEERIPLALAAVTHVLFGTDFPYLPAERAVQDLDSLGFSDLSHTVTA